MGVRKTPVLFNDRPILDYPGNAGITCPVRRRRVKEANIDMTVILEFLKFRGGVVRDKKEVNLVI
jgi:hypothetical protein